MESVTSKSSLKLTTLLNIDKLAEEVKKRRCLWNLKEIRATSSNKRRKCWQEIAKILCTQFETIERRKKETIVKEIQRRWKCLRDAYSRGRKRVKRNPALSNYKYFDKLDFLLENEESARSYAAAIQQLSGDNNIRHKKDTSIDKEKNHADSQTFPEDSMNTFDNEKQEVENLFVTVDVNDLKELKVENETSDDLESEYENYHHSNEQETFLENETNDFQACNDIAKITESLKCVDSKSLLTSTSIPDSSQVLEDQGLMYLLSNEQKEIRNPKIIKTVSNSHWPYKAKTKKIQRESIGEKLSSRKMNHDNIRNQVQTEEFMDPDRMFLLSLLGDFKKIPESQKLLTKIELSTLILKAQNTGAIEQIGDIVNTLVSKSILNSEK